MKWKRIDSKTRAEILARKIENPDLSTRDIEWSTWVDHTTVSRVLDHELQQVATKPDWQAQIDRLAQIVWDIEIITSKTIKSVQEKDDLTVYDVKVLNDIGKTNFERLQLLTGKATQNVAVLSIDESQANLIAQRWINKTNNSSSK
jgi:hypothetical protein